LDYKRRALRVVPPSYSSRGSVVGHLVLHLNMNNGFRVQLASAG